MEEGNIVVLVPEEKTFKVNKVKVRATKYMGNINDCSLLASWYYNNININAKKLVINIHGDYHITQPNPAHLTVEFINDENNTGKLHMSWNNFTQSFYQQNFPFAMKKLKKSKRKQSKKKKHSKKKKY